MLPRLFAAILAFTCAGPVRAADPTGADREALTFFGWSDQHVKVDGDGKHLLPAIDAMNTLAGAKYPERIGGVVAEPAFVLGCGDMTEWPSTAAKDTYNELVTKRLKFPSYEIAGNHDEGGKSPVETVKKWIIARHGSLSYTFDKGGVHFIALFSKYNEDLNNPAQPVTKEALDFLRKNLEGVPRVRPVVVALHPCLDALTNKDEFVEALGSANVILVLSGHYHKAQASKYRGVNFVQLPSPAPNGEREFTVIRVAPDRLIAIPYNYEKKQWVETAGKVLDVAVNRSSRAVNGSSALPTPRGSP
jgi:hypothetical protein